MAEIAVALTPPVWAQTAVAPDADLSYTAKNFRYLLYGMYSGSGVLSSAYFKVAPRSLGASYSVDVALGAAICDGAAGSTERYFAFLPAGININLSTINTNPPATRTHKIWLAIYDKLEGSTDYGGKLVFTEDTGAGAPNPSGSPTSAMLLATVAVSPGQPSIQAGHITDQRVLARGRPQAVAAGQHYFTVPANPNSPNLGPQRVSFPAGRFAAAPRVTVTQTAIPASSHKYMFKVAGITSTGFDLHAIHSLDGDLPGISTSGIQVDWHAISDV